MLTYSLSKITSFSPSTRQYLTEEVLDGVPRSSECSTSGGVFCDTKYVWFANGPRFQVLRRDGVKIAAWTFGALLKDPTTEVVCVKEIARTDGKLPLLAIATNSSLSWGLICIFDIVGSKVLRTIRMSSKVTSLNVVHSGYDVSPLPGVLQCFDGILAVGLAGGDAFLIDIYRQTCDELDEVRDELNPCELAVYTSDDLNYIELHKRNAIENGRHIALYLNAVLEKSLPHFILQGPKGDDRIHVNRIEVEVSAMHYCPQLCSLLIGYNFGAFQLWNLLDASLVYTSPIQEDNIPVSYFSILEPADDPRATCYVWAIYSHKKPIKKSYPIAALYAFNYHLRELHEGYGYLYQDFMSTSIRLEIDLTLIDDRCTNSKPQGACCISAVALSKNHNNQSTEVHDSSENTSSLFSMAWNVYCSDHEVYTYLIVFDLNQWYKEEMPRIPDWISCSTYMIHTCLSEIMNKDVKSPPCLDVCLNPDSLSQFIGVQRSEEHYCPTSLTFECVCLSETELSVIVNQGMQRTILSHLESTGPLALLRPGDVFKKCILAGLTPIFVDISDYSNNSVEGQREFLLSVALEQQLNCWLRKCASEWANGNYSSAGCTLDFLLTWAWRRASILKVNADKLCVPLFDYSGSTLDSNRQNLLNSSNRQLRSVCSFFAFVSDRFKSFIPLLVDIVQQQHKVLSRVSVYFEVLQWLLNVGLLPENALSSFSPLDEDEKITAPYPYENLSEYYNERRTTLDGLSEGNAGGIKNLLFIDNLIDIEFGHSLQKQWKNDGGTGLYPPASLQALLRTYLVEDVDLSIKHCLIIYVFLDLAMSLDQSRYKPIITHLIKFPAVFKVSPSIIKITQAFWQLDHSDFSTAIEQLLDPLVSAQDLKTWYHRTALHALLVQKQFNYALQYLQVRQPPIVTFKDTCLIISLYISNNLLDEAFYYYEKRKTCDGDVELLNHFFDECAKHNKFREIINRSLSPFEEEVLIKYLEESKHPEGTKLLYTYYTLRARYLDALRVCNHNRKRPLDKYSSETKSVDEGDIKRKLSTLPEVSRKLIDICNSKKEVTLWQQLPKSKPLSVFVHTTSSTGINYKSTIVNASLWKARETWLDMNGDGDAKKPPEITTSEEIPFLRTPNVTPFNKRTASSVKKHKLNDEVDAEDAPSPTKRSKLSPRQSLLVNKTNSFNVSSLNNLVHLDTPIVKRKTSRSSMPQTPSVCTPHSILKVRGSFKSDNDINMSRGRSVTPENLEDIINDGDSKSFANGQSRASLNLTARRPVSRLMVTFEDSKRLSSSLEDSSENNKILGESKSSSSEVFCSPNGSLNNSNTDEHIEEEKKETAQEISVEEEKLMNSHLPKSRRSYKNLSPLPVRSSPRLRRSPSFNNLETKAEGTFDTPKISSIETVFKTTKSVSQNVEAEGVVEDSLIVCSVEEKDVFTIEKDVDANIIKHTHNESVNVSSKKITEEDISSLDTSTNSYLNSPFDFTFKNRSFKRPQLSDSIFASISSTSVDSSVSYNEADKSEKSTPPRENIKNAMRTPKSRPNLRKSLEQKVLLRNTLSKMLHDTKKDESVTDNLEGAHNKTSNKTIRDNFSDDDDSITSGNMSDFEMPPQDSPALKRPVLSDSVFRSSFDSSESSACFESTSNLLEGKSSKETSESYESAETEKKAESKLEGSETNCDANDEVIASGKIEDAVEIEDGNSKSEVKTVVCETEGGDKAEETEQQTKALKDPLSNEDVDDNSNSNQFGVVDAQFNVFEVSDDMNVNYSVEIQADNEDIYGVSQVQLYAEEDEVLSEENSKQSNIRDVSEAEDVIEDGLIVCSVEENNVSMIDSNVLKHTHDESVNVSAKRITEEDISSLDTSTNSDLSSSFDFSFKNRTFKRPPQLSDSIFASISSISVDTDVSCYEADESKIRTSPRANISGTTSTPKLRSNSRKSLEQKVLLRNTFLLMLHDESVRDISRVHDKTHDDSFSDDDSISWENMSDFEMPPQDSPVLKPPVLSDSVFRLSYDLSELTESFRSTSNLFEDNNSKNEVKTEAYERKGGSKAGEIKHCVEDPLSNEDQDNSNSNHFGSIDAQFEESNNMNANESIEIEADNEDIYGVSQVQLYAEDDEVLSEINNKWANIHDVSESSNDDETKNAVVEEPPDSDEYDSEQRESEEERQYEEDKKKNVEIIEIDSTSEEGNDGETSNDSSDSSREDSNDSLRHGSDSSAFDEEKTDAAQVVNVNISEDDSSRSSVEESINKHSEESKLSVEETVSKQSEEDEKQKIENFEESSMNTLMEDTKNGHINFEGISVDSTVKNKEKEITNKISDNNIKTPKVIMERLKLPDLNLPARRTRSTSESVSTDEKIQLRSKRRRQSVDVKLSINETKNDVKPTPSSRRKRSASIDEVVLKNRNVNYQLRSNAEDVRPSTSKDADEIIVQPKRRTRSASVSNLPAIKETRKNNTKKINDDTDRRLTRRQIGALQKSAVLNENKNTKNNNNAIEEESKQLSNEDEIVGQSETHDADKSLDIQDYTASRRLTRRQMSLLQKSSSLLEVSVQDEEQTQENAVLPKKRGRPKKASSVKNRGRKKSEDRDSTVSEPAVSIKRTRRSSQDNDKSESESVCSAFSEPVYRMTRSRTKSVSSDSSEPSPSPVKQQEERRPKYKKRLPEIVEESES